MDRIKASLWEKSEQQPVDIDVKLGRQETQLDEQEADRVRRKIDRRLLPIMFFSYLLQFLDKVSLGQAAIMGIIGDLDLKGSNYSWASSVFYFGYLFFSYPAAYLVVRVRIAKYLALTYFLWGAILMGTAATNTFGQLVAVRFLLGMAEASVSPGFSLITGMWYTRKEQPFRHGVWFAGNSTAATFGGLLAFGIQHIQVHMKPWRWLFIIYGLLTLVWSIVMLIFLPDSPTTAKFLNEEERAIAIERIRQNQTGVKNNHWKNGQMFEALRDPKVWLLFFITLACNFPNGGITNFSGLLTVGFGYSTLVTLLLAMPMGAFILISVMVFSFLSTRLSNARCYMMICSLLLSTLGVGLVYGLPVDNKVGRLMGLMLWGPFSAAFPISLSLISSDIAGFTKKATSGATFFVAYCAGNIISPQLYFSDEAPRYQSGLLAAIVCQVAAIVIIYALRSYLVWENKRRERAYGPPVPVARYVTENDTVVIKDETDWENKSFRYVY